MKWNRQYRTNISKVVHEYEPSITVPDLSFSIKEIMEQFGKGLLDINVLKAQCRDELHLATGVYDLSDYSAAIKQTVSNYEQALADKARIEEALRSMQSVPSPSSDPAPVSESPSE